MITMMMLSSREGKWKQQVGLKNDKKYEYTIYRCGCTDPMPYLRRCVDLFPPSNAALINVA